MSIITIITCQKVLVINDDRYTDAVDGEAGDMLDVAITELSPENQESLQNDDGQNDQPLGALGLPNTNPLTCT